MQAEQVTVVAVSSVAAQVAQPVILLSHVEHWAPCASLKLPAAQVSHVLLPALQVVQEAIRTSQVTQVLALRKVSVTHLLQTTLRPASSVASQVAQLPILVSHKLQETPPPNLNVPIEQVSQVLLAELQVVHPVMKFPQVTQALPTR